MREKETVRRRFFPFSHRCLVAFEKPFDEVAVEDTAVPAADWRIAHVASGFDQV